MSFQGGFTLEDYYAPGLSQIMKIGGFQKNSLIDWEGKIASVIFVKGCNFRCPFCHNPELVFDPGGEAEEGGDLRGDILSYLDQWKIWLGGVVITGGEPGIYPDLPELIFEIKEKELPVKLDSNGSNPDLLEDLIGSGLVDYVAMDIKSGLDSESYRMACGKSVELDPILRSISILLKGGCDYEFRTTIVPGLFDRNEIELIGETIAGARRYILQPFKPGRCLDPAYNQREPYSDDYLLQLKNRVQGYVSHCQIRGES